VTTALGAPVFAEYRRLMCINSRRFTAIGPSHVSHDPLSCLSCRAKETRVERSSEADIERAKKGGEREREREEERAHVRVCAIPSVRVPVHIVSLFVCACIFLLVCICLCT